ncbi:MAG: SH3 domain-containing protein [Bacilli bacterium]|nr:SH3 domain-containing protein [Bacilli bacterium]
MKVRRKTKKIGKLLIFLFLILVIGGGAYYTYNKISEANRIKNIKKGWYVEIKSDYINLRSDCNASSKIIGKVNKGEIYKVLDVNLDTPSYFFFEIQVDKKTIGWIASSIAEIKGKPYAKYYNNTIDIKTPTLKFYEEAYEVYSIDKIKYDHLTIDDDSDDWEITSEVYHEVKPSEDIDQYWIKYTVTDKTGKSSSKVQKIIFDIKPSEDQVKSFQLMRNN